MRSKILPIVVLVAGAVAACGTKTSVTQVWSAQAPSTVRPMRKVLVMATRMDEANRRALEDSFVVALGERGVDAMPSYRVFPGALPARAQAEKAVHDLGVDGILTADFRGIREKLNYVPGYYAGGFWGGYYGSGYPYYSGGYAYTDEYVNVETTLWDAREPDTVVWAALTNTQNPPNGAALVKSVTKKVMSELTEARFIPPAPKKE